MLLDYEMKKFFSHFSQKRKFGDKSFAPNHWWMVYCHIHCVCVIKGAFIFMGGGHENYQGMWHVLCPWKEGVIYFVLIKEGGRQLPILYLKLFICNFAVFLIIFTFVGYYITLWAYITFWVSTKPYVEGLSHILFWKIRRVAYFAPKEGVCLFCSCEK